MKQRSKKDEDARFVANIVLNVLNEVSDLPRYERLCGDLHKLPVRALSELAEAIDIMKTGDGA